MSILAQLEPRDWTGNRRAVARRTLRLKAQGTTSSKSAAVVIHDLSLTGLLIETTADLTPGERLDVDIPQAGLTAARVVWSSGHFFGCEFNKPIPSAALSAAILRSRPHSSEEIDSDQISEALLELETLRSRVRQMTEHLGRVIDKLGIAAASTDPRVPSSDA